MDQFSVYRSSKTRQEERRMSANMCHRAQISELSESCFRKPNDSAIWEAITRMCY